MGIKKLILRKSLIRAVLFGIMVCTLSTVVAIDPVQAFPTQHWVLGPGEQFEVLRDSLCFGEGRAGERTAYKIVKLSKNVLSAEVFISGFKIWYTREGHDHEVLEQRVEAWVDSIGVSEPGSAVPDKSLIRVKLVYSMRDEDTTDEDDFNDACIGFTVIARTR